MKTQKKSESHMGFEPTTLRDLVGCSNHWATGDSVASKGQFIASYAATIVPHSQGHTQTMHWKGAQIKSVKVRDYNFFNFLVIHNACHKNSKHSTLN